LLRRYRERRGWSREELASRVDTPISADTVANVERGRTRPYRQTLRTVCAALGLSEPEQTVVLQAWHEFGSPRSASTASAPLEVPVQLSSVARRDLSLSLPRFGGHLNARGQSVPVGASSATHPTAVSA